MIVEDEFGGRRINDLRTPLWFGVALAMMVLQTSMSSETDL
jgi:hypothetical protein